jgi:phosphoglycolate phosphatase-like HAD superfamily hydrolase
MPGVTSVAAEPSTRTEQDDQSELVKKDSIGDSSTTLTTASARTDSVNARKGPEIDLIMVGDSADDMTAGYRAGAATVLLLSDANKHLTTHVHTDLVISR